VTADAEKFLPEWHRIVATRDLEGLRATLAPDITMGAPPYWSKLEGADLVAHLLGLIVHTIEDFTYHREWRDGPELALEFTGHVGQHEVQGIDLISLDEQNRIRNLDVLMRPLNTIVRLKQVIAPQMAEYLVHAASGDT
jgi:hypothetical protein